MTGISDRVLSEYAHFNAVTLVLASAVVTVYVLGVMLTGLIIRPGKRAFQAARAVARYLKYVETPRFSEGAKRLEELKQYSITHANEWKSDKEEENLQAGAMTAKVGAYYTWFSVTRGLWKDVHRMFACHASTVREEVLDLLIKREQEQQSSFAAQASDSATELGDLDDDMISELRKRHRNLTEEEFKREVHITAKYAHCHLFSARQVERPSDTGSQESRSPLLTA